MLQNFGAACGTVRIIVVEGAMAKGQSGFRLAGMAALVGTVLILASPTVCIAGSAPADGAEAQAQAPDGARRQSRAVLPLAGALAVLSPVLLNAHAAINTSPTRPPQTSSATSASNTNISSIANWHHSYQQHR